MHYEKKYKPSFHRANARFRGVTEHSQYTNFVLESVHDLLLLGGITDGNEAAGFAGHKEELYQNFVSVMTGDKEVGKTNLFTASTLQKIDRSRPVAIPDTLLNWSSLNGCQLTQEGDTFTLSSQGLDDPVGMYANLHVDTGEKIYIRLKVRSETGAPSFSFGSNNFRLGPGEIGDVREVPLEAGGDFIQLDYVLRVLYTGAISLNLNVHQEPDVLTPTSIEIKDLEIHYFDEKPIQAASFHASIKPNMDQLEEQINSIK